MSRTIVTRDMLDVSPVLPDENAAAAWLLRHQPMSVAWATEFEGYSFRAAGDDE